MENNNENNNKNSNNTRNNVTSNDDDHNNSNSNGNNSVGSYAFSIVEDADADRNELDVSKLELKPIPDTIPCEHVHFLRRLAREVSLQKAQSLLVQYATSPSRSVILATIFLFGLIAVWLTGLIVSPSVSLIWIIDSTVLIIHRFVYMRRKRNQIFTALGLDAINPNQFHRNTINEPIKLRGSCSVFYCQPKFDIVNAAESLNSSHCETGCKEIAGYNDLASRLIESGLRVNTGLCVCVYCSIFAFLFIFGFFSDNPSFCYEAIGFYLFYYASIGISYISCAYAGTALFC